MICKPIQRGIKALAPQVKKSRRELAEEAARGFVKEVVAITPPASKGKRGSAAKKAGEGAIIADLARVMVAAARKKGVKLADPAEIHKRLRDPHTGRINPRNLQAARIPWTHRHCAPSNAICSSVSVNSPPAGMQARRSSA